MGARVRVCVFGGLSLTKKNGVPRLLPNDKQRPRTLLSKGERERASVRREWTRDGGDDAGTGPRARRRRDVDDDDDEDDEDDERDERRTNGDAGEIVLGEGWENGGWNHETKRRFRKVVSRLRARV